MESRSLVLMVGLMLTIALSCIAHSSANRGFIRVSADKRHFQFEDGTSFFALGANYEGWFDRCWRQWEDNLFDKELLEKDFAKAGAIGLNTLRVFVQKPLVDDVLRGDFRKLDYLISLAKKYKIYLLITFYDYHELDLSKVIEVDRLIAQHLKDEPFVLGYDLRNEPTIWTIGVVNYPPGVKPLFHTDYLIHKYPDEELLKKVEKAAEDPGVLKKFSPLLSKEEIRNFLYDENFFNRYINECRLGGTAFKGLTDRLPMPGKWREVVKAIDESLGLWIKVQKEAIRRLNKNHLITVGYNSFLSTLPCNQALDFISQHLYEMPESFEKVMDNITVSDRLKKIWPDKPITYGEFGYSNGITIGDRLLDEHTSAVGEMAHYLYFYVHGYSGAYKWMLNDNPPNPSLYEARFGFFVYDEKGGSPKPIAYALKGFNEYLKIHPRPTGKLKIQPGTNKIPVVYYFESQGALFIGDLKWDSEDLKFSSELPVQVMITWDKKLINLVATADLQINLNPPKFISNWDSARTTLHIAEEGEEKQKFKKENDYIVWQAKGGKRYIIIQQ